MTANALALAEKLRILLRAFTIDERRFPSAEGKLRYNGIDFQTIHFIAANPGCSALSVAQHLGVAATTLQSVIDRLVRKAIVQRDKSPVDGRAVALSLTEVGHDISAAIRRQDEANCGIMLASLNAIEGRDLILLLEKICEDIAQ
jgi:DNA-binding MarR family transcriptional regulator